MNIAGRIGVGIAALMSLYMLANTARAWGAPEAFSQTFGVIVTDPAGGVWVQVYALRAAFIALLLAGLIAGRAWRALFLLSVAAIIMPVGDAWLTYSAGAPPQIYGRHLAIAALLIVASLLLAQAAATVSKDKT